MVLVPVLEYIRIIHVESSHHFGAANYRPNRVNRVTPGVLRAIEFCFTNLEWLMHLGKMHLQTQNFPIEGALLRPLCAPRRANVQDLTAAASAETVGFHINSYIYTCSMLSCVTFTTYSSVHVYTRGYLIYYYTRIQLARVHGIFI